MSYLVPNNKVHSVHFNKWEALLGFKIDGSQRTKPNLPPWFWKQLPDGCAMNKNQALALTNLLLAGCRIEEVNCKYDDVNKIYRVEEVVIWGLGFERMELANCFLSLKHCSEPDMLFFTEYDDWTRDYNRVAFAPDTRELGLSLENYPNLLKREKQC